MVVLGVIKYLIIYCVVMLEGRDVKVFIILDWDCVKFG